MFILTRILRRRIERYLRITIYLIAATSFLFYIGFPIIYIFNSSYQRHIVFKHDVELPSDLNFSNPELEGLSGAYNRYLTADNGIQLGVWQILPEALLPEIPATESHRDDWFLKQLQDSRPVVLYCHGNTPSRATPHRILLYQVLQTMNYHIITFDYRGYADSTKVNPSEDGVVADALAVKNWILQHSSSLLYIWGHSLGTGIATKASSQLCSSGKCPDALILQSPFTSIADELHNSFLTLPYRILPWFDLMFLNPLTKQGIIFDSEQNIRYVTCPILILHAEDDNVVPFKLGQKLFEAGKMNRPLGASLIKFIPFRKEDKYGHNYICKSPQLPLLIENFLEEAKKKTENVHLRQINHLSMI